MRTLQRSLLALCLIASVMANVRRSNSDSNTNSGLQDISESTNSFGTDFFKVVAKENEGNLICSPLSANIALSMAAIGAGGNTRQQFQNVLKLPSEKMQTLKNYQTLINTLNDVENVTLKLANKMFINKDFQVKPEYKADIQTFFHSDVESVDFFKNAKAAGIINGWAKDKTNNRIDSIVQSDDLNPDTKLVLANAVYFKGKWDKEFNPANTKNRDFHVKPDETREVPTMYRKGFYKFADIPEQNLKCIELPYANKEISMVIIIPTNNGNVDALVGNLNNIVQECCSLLKQTYEREVELYLPKFKTESKLNLEDTLSNKMNLDEPFSNQANFEGISETPLKIDKVVQKAFIEVNEEGSEAAAVTGVMIESYGLVYVEEFAIDRPFLYTIIKAFSNEETGNRVITPIFTGFVINPE